MKGLMFRAQPTQQLLKHPPIPARLKLKLK
jgi:hypothetical protein